MFSPSGKQANRADREATQLLVWRRPGHANRGMDRARDGRRAVRAEIAHFSRCIEAVVEQPSQKVKPRILVANLRVFPRRLRSGRGQVIPRRREAALPRDSLDASGSSELICV